MSEMFHQRDTVLHNTEKSTDCDWYWLVLSKYIQWFWQASEHIKRKYDSDNNDDIKVW